MQARSAHRKWPLAGVAAILLLTCLAARADPNDYVLLPTVTQGERELDMKLGVGSRGSQIVPSRAGALGFGYGVSDAWYSELSVQYVHEGGTGTRLDSVEWENILQVSEPGQWPVDVGVVLEVERKHDAAQGWNVRSGLLLQKDFDRLQINLNVLLRHRYGAETPQALRVDYQGQVKYRYSEPFEFGAQIFSELLPWQGWGSSARQDVRAGPAVFGAVQLTGARTVLYNGGLLFGMSGASYDRTLRLQIEYEF